MEVALSWDLFVIVFFALVITYTFIIGKHEAVKIIVATYIAIVAVQGLGNLLDRASGESEPVLNVIGITVDISLLSTTKLVLFIAAIIFLAVRGGLEVDYSKETGSVVDMVLTGVFGFATAGLLVTTLLSYVAGGPLLDTQIAQAESLSPIIQQSQLMSMMIKNQDIWFAMPALLLIAVGFISNE